MTAQSLLRRCAELGIKLTLKSDGDDRLVVDAPKGSLTGDLRDALSERKSDLIAILKTQAHAASRVQARTTPFSSHVSERTATESSEAISPVQETARTVPGIRQHVETQMLKLIAGEPFDAAAIDAKDPLIRETVRTQLLTALSSRNSSHQERARLAFMTYGYFEDAAKELRTAESPVTRAAAARQLGELYDHAATAHLVQSESRENLRRFFVTVSDGESWPGSTLDAGDRGLPERRSPNRRS